jgi:hypothetical protein
MPANRRLVVDLPRDLWTAVQAKKAAGEPLGAYLVFVLTKWVEPRGEHEASDRAAAQLLDESRRRQVARAAKGAGHVS